jgi:hypothetical protein
MRNRIARGVLAVVGALAITLVVIRASAAEVRELNEPDDVEEQTEALIPSQVRREQLGMTVETQLRLLQKLPADLGNGLFVDLPHQSRAFEAASNVKDPRTIAVALAADCDAFGTRMRDVLRQVPALTSGVIRATEELIGQVTRAPGSGMRLPGRGA